MSTVSPATGLSRLRCIVLGWLHYVFGFSAGAMLGIGVDLLLDMMAGRELEPWDYLQHEMRSIIIVGGGIVSLLGLWMGWRSYRPAHDAAAGATPRRSAFLLFLLSRGRGFAILIGGLLNVRFAVLTGASPPFRITLRVLAALLVGAIVTFTVVMGRDSEFFVAGYLGGGIAVLIADCLLVNRIARTALTGDGRWPALDAIEC